MFALVADVEQFAFYRIIMLYLRKKIDEYGVELLANFTTFVAGMALTVVTLWVMLQGWRIATGNSRESMMVLVSNAARAAFICVVATTSSMFSTDLHKFFTEDVNSSITELVTSDGKSADRQIDENMALMSVAMSAIDSVHTGGDVELDKRKTQAMVMAGIGAGGPAIVAGSMLLLFEMAMAMFIGFAPLFILCLLFDQTKSLFQRWLFYGLGTMFSMAMLAFVTSLAMEMMAKVAGALWLTEGVSALIGVQMEQGLSSQALQQGGLGLILTTLIVTTPPMAAMFFQGTLGSFSPYGAVGGGFNQAMNAPGGAGQQSAANKAQGGGDSGASTIQNLTRVDNGNPSNVLPVAGSRGNASRGGGG